MFNMYERQLPAAVMRERAAMLADAVARLGKEGYQEFEVDDLEGYQDPEEIYAPRTNVPIRPDIVARGEPGALYAVAEVSSVLSDELWGRRWRSLYDWACEHGAAFAIYVHPEDRERGVRLAEHWKVDPGCVVALERGG